MFETLRRNFPMGGYEGRKIVLKFQGTDEIHAFNRIWNCGEYICRSFADIFSIYQRVCNTPLYDGDVQEVNSEEWSVIYKVAAGKPMALAVG